MNIVRNDIENLVKKELLSSNRKYPLFHSGHEAYAVILEEYDEAWEELVGVNEGVRSIWQNVKEDNISKELKEVILEAKDRAVKLACEAVQVAAMLDKFIMSFEEQFNE